MGTTQKEGKQPSAVGMLEEAFRWMDKALRSLAIYTREHQVARSFETSTGQHFAAIPEQEGETWLELRAKSVRHSGRDVYCEDPETEGFVFRMHRDGIRRLCLLPGLSFEEVAGLVGVFQADLDAPEHFDDDMVTLMWDAELDSIKVIVADLLTLLPDDADLSSYQELMNSIIAAATEAGLPDGHEPKRDLDTVRLSLQMFGDLDPEQVVAALAAADVGSGATPYEVEQRRLAELRDAYHAPGLLERFVEILFRGVALEPDHAERACGSFDLLMRALLGKQRLEELLAAIELVDALDGDLIGTSGTAERMLEGLNKPERVRELVSSLESPDADVGAVLGIVNHLSAKSGSEVLSAAAELPDKHHRDGLIPLVAELCRECPERLSPSLESTPPLEVRLALDTLLAIGSEEALGCLRPLRRHEEPDMRITMLRLTQDLCSDALTEVRRAMLEDPHPRVRAEAERCLARTADPELVKRLFRKLVDGTLRDQSPAEKRRVCAILGAAGGERETRLLEELVRRGRVLSGRRQQELCVAAAHGLAATGDRRYLEILQQTASRRLMARQVRDACRQAAEALRSGRKPLVTKPPPALGAEGQVQAPDPPAQGQPDLPALDPSERDVGPGGGAEELALAPDEQAPVLPALDPSERDASGRVDDRDQHQEELLPPLEEPEGIGARGVLGRSAPARGGASPLPSARGVLGRSAPARGGASPLPSARGVLGRSAPARGGASPLPFARERSALLDLGFVDLEGDSPLPPVEPQEEPDGAGAAADPAADPELDALLRGYVDTVPRPSEASDDDAGGAGGDDAVDELLQRYLEADSSTAETGAPPHESGERDLEQLLRSYVEDEE